MSSEAGGVQYELRRDAESTAELLNMAEKQRFMNGEKVRVNPFDCIHFEPGLAEKKEKVQIFFQKNFF